MSTIYRGLGCGEFARGVDYITPDTILYVYSEYIDMLEIVFVFGYNTSQPMGNGQNTSSTL